METIRIYEPHEGRWLDVPIEFVHDHEAEEEDEEKNGEPVEDA